MADVFALMYNFHLWRSKLSVQWSWLLYNLDLYQSQRQSHFTVDSQSVCLGVEPTLWTFRLEFVVSSLWGALSDERPGLPFVSHSLVICLCVHLLFTFFLSHVYHTYIYIYIHYIYIYLSSIYIKMNVCMFVCPVCVPIPFIRLRWNFGELLCARPRSFLNYFFASKH
jgi:hypothetical protein